MKSYKGNLHSALEQLAGIGKAHGHAPEMEEPSVTVKNYLFLLVQVERRLIALNLEVDG